MKKIVLCGALISLSLFSSEKEVRNLIKRQDDQTTGFIFAMAALGLHHLVKNSEQICSTDNPYCWRVVAPIVVLPALCGCILYHKVKQGKGRA